METKTINVEQVQGTNSKKRNYSLPEEFIREMIKKPKLNDIFWSIANQEPDLKAGMLIALAKREFNQLKTKE